jgi:hypothetical protein
MWLLLSPSPPSHLPFHFQTSLPFLSFSFIHIKTPKPPPFTNTNLSNQQGIHIISLSFLFNSYLLSFEFMLISFVRMKNRTISLNYKTNMIFVSYFRYIFPFFRVSPKNLCISLSFSLLSLHEQYHWITRRFFIHISFFWFYPNDRKIKPCHWIIRRFFTM